jgi:hypothetical protein
MALLVVLVVVLAITVELVGLGLQVKDLQEVALAVVQLYLTIQLQAVVVLVK